MSGTCDSSPDLPCCFLPHLYRGLFAVPSSMRGTNQIWCILQRTLTKTEGKRNKIIAKFQVCTCIIRNAFRGGGIGVNYYNYIVGINYTPICQFTNQGLSLLNPNSGVSNVFHTADQIAAFVTPDACWKLEAQNCKQIMTRNKYFFSITENTRSYFQDKGEHNHHMGGLSPVTTYHNSAEESNWC